MDDNFSELDSIVETDILAALGEPVPEVEDNVLADTNDNLDAIINNDEPLTNFEGIDDIEIDTANEDAEDDFESEIIEIDESEILPLHEIESAIDEQEPIEDNNTINMNNSSLASLLTQLFNNKTIEITIKIRD